MVDQPPISNLVLIMLDAIDEFQPCQQNGVPLPFQLPNDTNLLEMNCAYGHLFCSSICFVIMDIRRNVQNTLMYSKVEYILVHPSINFLKSIHHDKQRREAIHDMYFYIFYVRMALSMLLAAHIDFICELFFCP